MVNNKSELCGEVWIGSGDAERIALVVGRPVLRMDNRVPQLRRELHQGDIPLFLLFLLFLRTHGLLVFW